MSNKRELKALKEIKAMLECQFYSDGTTSGIKGAYMKMLINIANEGLGIEKKAQMRDSDITNIRFPGDTMRDRRKPQPVGIELDGLVIDVAWEGKTYSGYLTELSKKILIDRFGTPKQPR